MLVSVLCPSRGRPGPLQKSIDSLGSGDFEFLVALDEDDPADYSGVEPHGLYDFSAGPRHAYVGLHHYYNDLAARARGDWLLLWNDDVLMETPDWLELIGAHEPTKVLGPHDRGGFRIDGHPLCTFPIVPTAWVHEQGYMSKSPHVDSWWEETAEHLECLQWVEIQLHHDRADLTGHNDDQTFAEGRKHYDKEFWEMRPELKEAAERLRAKVAQ